MTTIPALPHLSRRQFLGAAGLTAAGAALRPLIAGSATAEAAATAPRRPNVLFVLADQWRFSAFSHETDPLVQTPNMDRFASQSARFTRMYAADPVCGPNRAAILTGRFPHQTGMVRNGYMLPPEERCLAESFREAGYATHYIGKWHLDGSEKPGFVPPGWRRRGFERFEGFNAGHYYPTGAQYFTSDGKLLHPDKFESFYQTDLAVDFMKRHRDQPFFCYLSWGPPHTPYAPPPEFDRFAKMEKLRWRPNVPEALRDSARLKTEMAGYFGLCELLDHEMERLLAALDGLGLSENTLVVFSSDHGDMHGSHGLHRKNRAQEESLHIPLFMRLPGRIKPAQKPALPASSVDLMPTLLGLCGLKIPATRAGRDLSAAVLGGPAPKVESVYAEGCIGGKAKQSPAQDESGEADEGAGGAEWRAVVTATHKFVTDVGGEQRLYDLEHDPYEMRNLADKPEHAALKQELQSEMRRWAQATADRYPNPTPRAKKFYEDEARTPRS